MTLVVFFHTGPNKVCKKLGFHLCPFKWLCSTVELFRIKIGYLYIFCADTTRFKIMLAYMNLRGRFRGRMGEGRSGGGAHMDPSLDPGYDREGEGGAWGGGRTPLPGWRELINTYIMLDNGDANIFFFSRRGGQTETVFK